MTGKPPASREIRPRILVSSESAEYLDQARAELEGAGYDVLLAYDGSEVVHRVHRERPDVLVIDTDLPIMDGYAVIGELESRRRPGQMLPVILVSADGGLEARQRMIRAGAHDFLTRPFDRVELLARVDGQLRAKRLNDQLAEAQRTLEREREITGAVQRRLLPGTLPRHARVTFAAKYVPSAKSGGDYYDILDLPGGRIALIMLDVSGHGVSAAVSLGMARAVIRIQAGPDFDPVRTLDALNLVMRDGLDAEEYMTAYIGVFDPATGELQQAIAGHHPPLVLQGEGNSPEVLDLGSGFPLGVEESNPCPLSRVVLAPGARLLVFTDGLLRQRNPAGEVFGLPRLRTSLLESRQAVPERALLDLVTLVRVHAGTVMLRDDATLLIMDYN